MNHQQTVQDFFNCLNTLDWTSLNKLIAEISALQDSNDVAVGQGQIVKRYRKWLADLKNLTIHVMDLAENDHSIFAETTILEDSKRNWNQVWVFHFDHQGLIDRIRCYRQ